MQKVRIIAFLNSFIHKNFGIRIVRASFFETISVLPRFAFIWKNLSTRQQELISPYLPFSVSQNCQDIAVLALLGAKERGIFVEVGAGDGILMSNTYLLEKKLSWTGLLIEPAESYYPELTLNRNALIAKDFIGPIDGAKYDFFEITSSSEGYTREFSTADINRIQNLRNTSGVQAQASRKECVSLKSNLVKNNLPNYIDFISIDIEGLEYQVLSTFPFDEYGFGVICVEHNFTKNRIAIRRLLESNGYLMVFEDLFLQDDLYVSKSVFEDFNRKI